MVPESRIWYVKVWEDPLLYRVGEHALFKQYMTKMSRALYCLYVDFYIIFAFLNFMPYSLHNDVILLLYAFIGKKFSPTC